MNAHHYFIYRAYAADGALLYIGRTIEPRRRMKEHLLRSSWALEVAEWEFEPVAPRWSAMCDLERAAIEAERPRYNRQWNTPKENIA